MRKRAAVFVSSALIVAGASCGLVTGLGDLSREEGTLVDAAPFDAAQADVGDAAAITDVSLSDSSAMDAGVDSACPGTAGPTAIRVGTFCIDSTEVTNEDYGVFLATSTAPADAGPHQCSYKTTHKPIASGDVSNYPVGFVDWCDAYAYCAWAGKRLCGKVSGGPSGSFVDSTNQWFMACTHGRDGFHDYPYGKVFTPFTCNTPEVDAGGTKPVGSLAGCTGGYPGVYDMTGNVYEWEDSCDVSDPAAAHCIQRGGSFIDPPAASQTCAYSRSVGLTIVDKDIGFRCCSP